MNGMHRKTWLMCAEACAAAMLLVSGCGGGARNEAWIKGQGTLPELADMALCYGGGEHRNPYRWDKERFAPHVSYVDREGQEHWLFESFLAIEFVEGRRQMDFSCASPLWRSAADKECWTALLDYWFEDGYGFDALEAAVEDVKGRIGDPKCRRLVIMTLPDPIMHTKFADPSSSSAYWGELDGRALDFARPEDRIAAEKWFIDETRSRFAEKNYRNIELIGFYIVSEDLGCKVDGVEYGWCEDLKHYPDYLPQTADYIHGQGEGLYWVPYFDGAGYQVLDFFKIDLCIMQPNYYWGRPENRMSEFADLIEKYGLGMELEFDERVLHNPPAGFLMSEGEDGWSEDKASEYRQNLRDYMDLARKKGIYGTKPFAMYAGENAFYLLSQSSVPQERELFDEICEFIINNPIKKY